MTLPDLQPVKGTEPGEHDATELQRRELGIIGLGSQQPETNTDTVAAERTESPREIEDRFDRFMRELFSANEAAYEYARNEFSFHGTLTRTESMLDVMNRYGGFVTESTSQPDEVVSPDVPLSEE